MDQKSQENLEAKLKEVRNSDEFTKLTPAEQKQKLQEIKDEAQLTFGDFSKSEKYNPAPEKNEQAEELKKLEQSLGEKPTNHSESQEHNQGFLHLLKAAEQNIANKTPIPFPTISLDSAGRATPAFAHMTKLSHYNIANPADSIKQPVILRLEINFNNDKPQENLQDLSLEITLQAIHDQLQKGHRLTDILSSFTNLVLSAAAEHKQKSPAPAPKANIQKPSSESSPTTSAKKINFGSNNLENLSGAFSQDSLSAVTFNSKSGQIWGQLDLADILATHQAPAESTDQKNTEK
ncbi:MAG: hypothetical protein ACRCZE_01710 [Candidatus Altimarinota bacterium]